MSFVSHFRCCFDILHNRYWPKQNNITDSLKQNGSWCGYGGQNMVTKLWNLILHFKVGTKVPKCNVGWCRNELFTLLCSTFHHYWNRYSKMLEYSEIIQKKWTDLTTVIARATGKLFFCFGEKPLKLSILCLTFLYCFLFMNYLYDQ